MANNFSGDPNCVALWKLDNNANDSQGGNDLTEVGSPSYDSGDYKEGSYCIDLERDSTQYGTIADADLDSGFPNKNGTSEQSFSACFWCKPESLTAYNGLIAKNGANDSWAVILDASNKVRFVVYYSGGNTGITFGTALSTGIWYHIAITYDASTNGMKIRIWDDNAGALLDSNATGTVGGDLIATTAPLEIGRQNEDTARCFDGKFDEVVFFKDILSDDDIDAIRAGTYGSTVTEKNSADPGSGAEASLSSAILTGTESGSGVDAVESLQTPQAKTSSDTGIGAEASLSSAVLAGTESGSGIEAIIARLLAAAESGSGAEASKIGGSGEPKDLFADEPGEGTDRLVAKIEMPVKGGGMKLWT